ncbi:alpha-ketoglutarate-dependent dioxygenase AlkB family protein [Legionella rowbothamii]|uniref:alpha-ketoglutarate-dependent dioxygenase AlkB family protein n=1 Tax=Legionella rowbothamii TaxID=96229 RepID=UPI001A94C1D6|nr:alpha-ketoglutarate-dependent dioxygenase AlkB [Legionella rowbothamii]
MDLIEQINGELHNLLPYEGTVHYYGPIMTQQIADDFYDVLMQTIEWKNDEAIIYGKKIITKRKVAWYADQPFSYTYSKITKTAQPWLPILHKLKIIVEKESGETYNSCLLNLYHDGNEGMAWHSDAEKDLKQNGAIGSLSFGAERKFSFKHKKTHEIVSKILQHGSLLVMKDSTQSNWLHRLPPTKITCMPRINLTFRTIVRTI